MFLVFVRGFVLVVFLLWLFYSMNPSVECAINQRWQYVKDHFGRVSDFLQDRQFEVTLADRRPSLSYPEFMARRNKQAVDRFVRSRLTHKDRDVVGSVMTDGPNATLPANFEWRDGRTQEVVRIEPQ